MKISFQDAFWTELGRQNDQKWPQDGTPKRPHIAADIIPKGNQNLEREQRPDFVAPMMYYSNYNSYAPYPKIGGHMELELTLTLILT